MSETEFLPGTVRLIDTDHTLHLKKGTGSHADIILNPQPLNNINDPLRWSQRKKNAQFSLLFCWAFFLAVTVNWTGPYYTQFTIDLNCNYDQLNVTTALCFLFLGLGCVFLQPTALKLGRRFVYLFCTILALVSNVIGMKATNLQYLFANNALSGFAAAPVDSLVEISSTDVFFTHERASKLSWLIFALYAGSYIGPLVAAYLPNWKWCFEVQVFIFIGLFLLQVFLMEDTTFLRNMSFGEVTSGLEEQMESPSKEALDSKQITPVVSSASETDGCPKRSYFKRMQPLELEYNLKEPWFRLFYSPILTAPFPAIIWGGVAYGAQMMWLSLMNVTQSEIFLTQYGFSTSSIGLTNLAPFVGSVIGMFYGGAFVDWLSVQLAKRNNGILEAEFRLYAMIFPTITNAVGVIAYGIAANNKASWGIPVVIGQGFLGFSMSATGPICLTYAIECYPKLSSECLVLMLFVRNMIGCGFTWGIQSWINASGLVVTTWLMFMISLVLNGAFILFLIWGKKWRRMTAAYYERILKTIGA